MYRSANYYCVGLRQARHGAASLSEAKGLLQAFVDAHASEQEIDEVPVIEGETLVAVAESCEWAAKELGFGSALAFGCGISN